MLRVSMVADYFRYPKVHLMLSTLILICARDGMFTSTQEFSELS